MHSLVNCATGLSQHEGLRLHFLALLAGKADDLRILSKTNCELLSFSTTIPAPAPDDDESSRGQL